MVCVSYRFTGFILALYVHVLPFPLAGVHASPVHTLGLISRPPQCPLFTAALPPPQVWPFVAWAALVIVMNAVPYSMLTSMSSSIALLNLINSVLLRHHHCFYFAMVSDV